MKIKAIRSVLLIFVIISMFYSCDKFRVCDTIQKSETLMLFDVSDNKLFEEINTDLSTNFSNFMKQTSFANTNECQESKMSLGTLSGKDELNIKTESISLLSKGLSKQEKRKKTNPSSIIRLVRESLALYEEMSNDKKYNSSTNIFNTTIKSIIGMDVEADNTLLIFSDMVIYNKIDGVNFYKSVPVNVKSTLRKLADPTLLQVFKNRLEEGLEVKIIVVLKKEQLNRVKRKDIKAFWLKAFNSIELNEIEFIDNLSNEITIWEN